MKNLSPSNPNQTLPQHFIFDVDGVMTTGHFLYSEQGKIYKIFGPHDNDGIKMISKKLKVLFVTADKRGFPITKKRIVEDMGQELIFLSEADRLSYIGKNFKVEHCIYMGDGVFDAEILKRCLFGIAPKNARIEARNAAKFITPSRSGEGAVLDACLKVLEVFFPGDRL